MMQLAGILLMVSTIVGFSMVLYYYHEQQVAVLRYSLITLFSTLPAIMYFVFIAWRKTSLFQDYVSNLHRLGLLSPAPHLLRGSATESDQQYFGSVRIRGYIKRFEGVYGPVSEEITEELINNSKRSSGSISRQPSALTDNESTSKIFSLSTAIPVFVATALITIGWYLYLPPLEYGSNTNDLMAVLAVNPNPIIYGFIGAYFFCLQMLYRRFVTNDLRAKAYIGVSMRIILSILGAWVLFMVLEVQFINFSTETFALLAFVLGVFPTVLWRMVRTAASQFTGQWLPSIDSPLPVRELDGLTVWHQARLEEEDIENTFNMANADIIDLFLHTKIPADRAIDWVDQAILLSCISPDSKETSEYQEKRSTLKKYGIHSASGISALFQQNGELRNSQQLGSPLENISADQMTLLRSTYSAVQNYSNLQLVRNWKTPVNALTFTEIMQQSDIATDARDTQKPVAQNNSADLQVADQL